MTDARPTDDQLRDLASLDCNTPAQLPWMVAVLARELLELRGVPEQRQPLVEALGDLAGEHRFLNHTSQDGDICYCGWRDQDEPHSYHQARVLLEEFDIQRREARP